MSFAAHRDIKPANFLLYKMEMEVVVKVSDFGCSREQTSHTSTDANKMMLTLAYSAPERLLDKKDRSVTVSGWPDVFCKHVFVSINSRQSYC